MPINPPTVSLISSFSTLGFVDAMKSWPRHIRNVDLYAFMQEDLQHLFSGKFLATQPVDANAVEVMAAAARRSSEVEYVANRIKEEAKKSNTTIVSFATFIPELLAGESNRTAWENAQKALYFLIELARSLKRKGHYVRCIELVGGSRIREIEHDSRSTKSTPRYTATRLSRRQAIDLLIGRLEKVAEHASQTEKVFLALELEPGPLFAISDRDALVELCRLIANHRSDSVKRTIGINIDIPHYEFLANISPEWLNDPSQSTVFNRIVHAHICDHLTGHVCDSVIGAHHEVECFEKWLTLLRKRKNQRSGGIYPEYSGYVSCEMEACPEISMVTACFDRVKAIVDS